MAAASGFLAASRLRAAAAAAAWPRLVVRGVAGPPRTGPTLAPGLGDLEHDLDSDWEPEQELRELQRGLKQKKREILLQKIRRQMEASGAPQRTLSRNAMEQIRYLHKEFSEDWSVPRLAEGFGVSTDVIRRVLKSKFVPTLKQGIKQDQKILSKARIIYHPQMKLALQEQPPLPTCTGHLVSGLMSTLGNEALPYLCHKGQNYNLALQEKEKNLKSGKIPRNQKVKDNISQILGKEKHTALAAVLGDYREKQSLSSSPRNKKQPEGFHVDRLLRKKEEKVVKEPETDGKEFSSKVFKKGKEFFDSNGNFLYRI